jgi:predicted nuclease of predicted toxin-antitoxin system
VAVRLLLDENLSERLIPALAPRFADTLHVRVLGLGGAADTRLWEVAAREQCLLVTKDEDFVQLSVLRGPPPKVLWLNVGNAGTPVITRLVLQNAEAIEAFVAHPELAFLALGVGPRAS